MQTPAPFGYERATSVDHAIQLLEQLGPEARLVAGGHSLLPMMKIRLAQPEHLIDINPLAAELGTISDRRRRDGDRRDGASQRPARLGAGRRALPGPHRRRAGDRRSDRAQPWHGRRFALPGRPRRGPVGGTVSARRHRHHPRVRAATRSVPVRELHTGPYETVVGDAEILTEIRVPIRDGAGSAYEKVERRVGDWAIAAAAVVRLDGRRHDHRCRRRPRRRRRAALRVARRRGGAHGATSPPTTSSPPRLPRRAPTANPPPISADRPSTSDTSPANSPRERSDEPSPERREATDVPRSPQRARRHASPSTARQRVGDRRGAHAARALHPRSPRPDRHPLGVRHLQLRGLRRERRRDRHEELHRARRDGRRRRRSPPSKGSPAPTVSARSSRASWSVTASSAGSARPA